MSLAQQGAGLRLGTRCLLGLHRAGASCDSLARYLTSSLVALLVATGLVVAGLVAPRALAADTITVNGATRYQTMNGWEAHARSWEIDKINDQYDPTWPVHAQAVADRLVDELGLNRIQLPIRSGWENPVDYWTQYVNRQISYTAMKSHWYEKVNDNGNPAVVNPGGFQFAEFDYRVDTMLLPMRQRLAAKGEKLYVNVVVVDFGAVGGYLTGSLELSQNPAEYAEFVQVYLDRLKTKYGITADALEIVNEPENTDFWRGTQIGQALVAVSNRLQSAGYGNLNYIGPTTASAGSALPYMTALAAVPGALSRLKTLSYHRYGTTDFNAIRSYAQANNLQTDMSEFFNATVDQLIEDLTVSNVSSWQKWAIADRTGRTNPQAFYYLANLSNPASPVFTMAPNTAFMAQYFRYVRLGAVRIAAQSSVATRLPVAFINTNGSYVVVVKTNAGTGAQAVTVSGLPNGTYGVRTVNFGQQASDLPDVVAANGILTLTLPEGFTTIYGKGVFTPPPPPTLGALSVTGTGAFASQTVGTTSAAKTITLTNTGGSPVVVQSIVSSNAAEFPITSSTCGTVNPAGSCTFAVAFKPAATGSRSATLTITSNGVGSPQTLSASGTGTATATQGNLIITGSATFAEQLVGSTSAWKTITLTNTGGSAVVVQSIVSSNSSEFPITVSTCGTVNPAASCTFAVAFKPAATGGRSATLTITSNGVGSPQTLAANGTGTATATQRNLTITGTVTFASQTVGSTGSVNTITLTNTGGSPVVVQGIVSNNSAEFPITGSTCGTVNPADSCSFAVAFKPAATGWRTATLTVTSNGVGSPQIVTVGGIGTDDEVQPPSPDKITLVEYYHGEWDHYFVTGIDNETAMLDAGLFAGWTRTGLQFAANRLGASSGSPVCRFFSTSFNPRSSHFYTVSDYECAIVKTNPDWLLEGQVFNMFAAASDGSCAAGTIPVYRMYNNGHGAAPNHRFTTDPVVRSQMVEAGWTSEGYGPSGVIMCAPG